MENWMVQATRQGDQKQCSVPNSTPTHAQHRKETPQTTQPTCHHVQPGHKTSHDHVPQTKTTSTNTHTNNIKSWVSNKKSRASMMRFDVHCSSFGKIKTLLQWPRTPASNRKWVVTSGIKSGLVLRLGVYFPEKARWEEGEMTPETGFALAYHPKIYNLVSVCLTMIHSVITCPISTKLDRGGTKGHTTEGVVTIFTSLPKGVFHLGQMAC